MSIGWFGSDGCYKLQHLAWIASFKSLYGIFIMSIKFHIFLCLTATMKNNLLLVFPLPMYSSLFKLAGRFCFHYHLIASLTLARQFLSQAPLLEYFSRNCMNCGLQLIGTVNRETGKGHLQDLEVRLRVYITGSEWQRNGTWWKLKRDKRGTGNSPIRRNWWGWWRSSY